MQENKSFHTDPNRNLGLNILLVDDHALNRFMVQTILEKWNCNILIAEDGLEAIEKVIFNPKIDLILMDMRMPVMDGKTASEFIRNRLRLTIPIIAITSDAIHYKNETADCGITYFISKPFGQDELYEKSRQAMEHKVPVLPQSCMDLFTLYSQGNNDKNFICKMIDLFLEDAPKKITLLHESVKNEKQQVLMDIAHTIKPSLTYLASDFVAETALNIEKNIDYSSHLIYAESLLLIDQLKKLMGELKNFRLSLNS